MVFNQRGQMYYKGLLHFLSRIYKCNFQRDYKNSDKSAKEDRKNKISSFAKSFIEFPKTMDQKKKKKDT